MLLGELKLLNKDIRIEGTTHALERMKEREIDKKNVVELIRSLHCKVLSYNNTGDEVALIDQENDIAVIIEVRFNKVVIITVINRANIHIKDGTLLEEIA